MNISLIKLLVDKGKAAGFLTFDEVVKALPVDVNYSEQQFEELIVIFEQHDIALVDTEEDGRKIVNAIKLSVLLKQLNKEYPNGVSFEPLALRILRQKMLIDEAQIEVLKTELFQMKNGLWYHGNMILSTEKQSLLEEKIQEYFERSKLFSVAQLLGIFKSTLRHVKNVQDCALFLQYLGYSVEVWKNKHYLCVASRYIHIDVLESISHSIFEYIESSNGTVSKEDICEKFPQFSVEVLDDIRINFLPNVLETEISDTICWSTADALILPDDFSEKLTDIVDTLVDIGKSASVVNISFALDLFYKMSFCEGYSLESTESFKAICKENYKGNHKLFSRAKKQLQSRSIVKKLKNSIPTKSSSIHDECISFKALKIPIGAKLIFVRDNNIFCTVLNDKNSVMYQGRPWEILSLVQHLAGIHTSKLYQLGYKLFEYQGENLRTRCLRLKCKSKVL